jgi:hypothetical protein
LFTGAVPAEFRVGPVRFLGSSKFFADYQTKVEADHASENERRRAELDRMIAEGKFPASEKMSAEDAASIEKQLLDTVFEYYHRFLWIGEVAIPPSHAKISEERADNAVQAALDLLKLGLDKRGADLRLGHDPAPTTSTARLTRDPNGEFNFSMSFGGEGVFIEEGWLDGAYKEVEWVFAIGGAAIDGYINPKRRTDHQGRWLDALHWFGQAVSDRRPSAQLVKFVAALERLTVTNETGIDEVTDVVTRRAALLSTDDTAPDSLRSARENAREVYRWRSDLMHGRTSPLTPDLMNALRLARDLVPRVLVGALDLFGLLESRGAGKSGDLEKAFLELEKSLPP